MKNPREILLKRHQAVEGRLDAIRDRVVARELNRPVANAASGSRDLGLVLLRLPLRIWQELFWSCLRTWVGLAAAWLVLIAVNLLSLDEPSAGPTTGRAAERDIWALLAERERLLAEAGETTPPSVPPPPAAAPRPRSEYRFTNRARC